MYFLRGADPITDENSTGGIAIASDSPSYYEGALMVRCSSYIGSEIDIFLDSDQYLGSDDYFAVIYRIDRGEPRTSSWGTPTDGVAAFAPVREIPQVVAALAAAAELVIRVMAYAEPQAYIVPVAGLREVLAERACYAGTYWATGCAVQLSAQVIPRCRRGELPHLAERSVPVGTFSMNM